MKLKKIMIVSANYYPNISSNMEQDVKKYLRNIYKDFNKGSLILNVPGVFEIPVTIARNIKKYDAFIALGCVIKGETPHFDFISMVTTEAIMKLSIDYKKPIGNGIITCLNGSQARNGKKKGAEAAKAVISVLSQI